MANPVPTVAVLVLALSAASAGAVSELDDRLNQRFRGAWAVPPGPAP
jgi:hypothetical protein